MDKTEDICEDFLKNISEKEPQSALHLYEALKMEAQYYKEANEKMENLLKKLRLPEDLNPLSLKKLEELTDLQEAFEAKDSRLETLGLSYTDKNRKYTHYLAKVKICMKTYFNLNEYLLKQIASAKSAVEVSQIRISNITLKSDEDIKILESRINRYEKELFKLEKRYTWLKDPEFNLQIISKKLDALRNVKIELVVLQKELEQFKGLKPDIVEATQQLHSLKEEYNSLNKLVTSAK